VLRFTIRRLVLTIPVLLGVATLVFSLLHLVPGDPALAMLGESASASDVGELRGKLGLDKPLPAQYLQFVIRLTRADLGTSFRYNTPVASEIGQRLPRTMQLAAAAIVVAIVLAIPLGVVGALFRGTAEPGQLVRGNRRLPARAGQHGDRRIAADHVDLELGLGAEAVIATR